MNREIVNPKSNRQVESKLNEANERIIYLEEKVDGSARVKREPSEMTFKNMKNELMKGFDDRAKDLMSKHEENEETKTGLEKRIKNVERKMRDLDEQQQQNTLDLRQEIDTLNGSPDPTATKDLEKKMQQLDQKRRKDNQNIQDDLMDLGNIL
jgi:hypothetical protein